MIPRRFSAEKGFANFTHDGDTAAGTSPPSRDENADVRAFRPRGIQGETPMLHRIHRGLPGAALVVALGVGAVLAPNAHAANTVQNSNFTTDFSFWSGFQSGTVDADPAGAGSAARTNTQDVDGLNPTAGAALVTLTAAAPSDQAKAAFGMHQCVNLGAPAPTVSQANYGARIKVPTSNTADGSVNVSVEIRFYSDTACTNFIPGAGGTQGRNIATGVPDDGFWYAAADASFIPPPSTVAGSAEVRATLRRNSASSGTFTGFFDNVYLSLNGTTPVSLQGFEVE